MSVIPSHPSLIHHFIAAVTTGTVERSSLLSHPAPTKDFSTAWAAIIDGKLIEWGKDASARDNALDDDFIRPTAASVRRAIGIAYVVIDLQPPRRVAPTGDGGLSFEWESGRVLRRIEFFEDGQAVFTRFEGADVVMQEVIAA